MNALLCSGIGQFHTNEPDPSNPNKRLREYECIRWWEIQQLVTQPLAVDKQNGRWLIPSAHLSRSSHAQREHGEFWCLWADFDDNPKGLDELAFVVDLVLAGSDFELYTTRSATIENQKARLLIPLGQGLKTYQWVQAQRRLNGLLESTGFIPDRSAERPSQLCYLPNRGEIYRHISIRDGERLEGDIRHG